MKKILALLLALVLVFSMVACGAKEEAPAAKEEAPAASEEKKEEAPAAEEGGVTINFWTLWNENEPAAELYKEAIAAYEADTGNTVVVNWAGRDISKVMVASLDAGEAIDVFDNDAQWIAAYMSPDYLLKLDDYITQPYGRTDGKPLNETLMPILNTYAKEFQGLDSYYFVPAFPNIAAIFYNKDILEEAGVEEISMDWTWDDFMDVCQKIKEAGYYPMTVDDAYYCMMLGVYLEMANGPEWIHEMQADTTGEMWGEASVLQMAEAYAEMYEKGYFSPSTGSNVFPAGQQEIPLGTTAMYLNGSWYPNEVSAVAGPDFNWGAAPFPNIPNAAESNKYISFVCNGFCVNKNTEYPAEAVELVSYILSADCQGKFAQQLANVPATVGTAWPAVLADAEAIFNNAEGTTPWLGGFQDQAEINAIAGEAFAKLISGGMTPKEFVAYLQENAHA